MLDGERIFQPLLKNCNIFYMGHHYLNDKENVIQFEVPFGKFKERYCNRSVDTIEKLCKNFDIRAIK